MPGTKTLYFNPNCNTCRIGKGLLDDQNETIMVKEYLKEPMTADELRNLLAKLNLPAEAIIRKKDAAKLGYDDSPKSDEEWITEIIKNPILLQRPILVTDTGAVVGRPPELLTSFLKK